jgi:TolB protein
MVAMANSTQLIADLSPHSFVRHLLASFAAVFLLLASFATLAQDALRIDIAGVGTRQIPIAIAPFKTETTEAAEAAFAQTVVSVIRANLARSGLFSIVDAGTPDPVLSDRSDIEPLFIPWREKGAEALVIGSSTRRFNNRIEVRFLLLDNLRNEALGGLAITSTLSELEARRTGHRISDYIYEKLTGDPGLFATRLAFVRKDPKGFALIISDSDGQNTQVALRSREPLISLAWSPDGNRLAYVSFETGKPVVFVHALVTGERFMVANETGSNSAPAWSPDGKRLAVTLTKDGISQIYTVNAKGGDLRRVSQTDSIDTEPAFSPDGKFIYFTSDRGGSAQIYRMPVNGGAAQRITFNGPFNGRPQISEDGKFMAYVALRERIFRIAVMNLATQQEQLVSNGPKDDSPSFAPNGRWVIYSSRAKGQNILAAVSLDGKLRTRLSADGSEIRGPAWGKLP